MWVDGEGGVDLGAHLEGCDTCRETAEFYRRTVGAVGAMLEPTEDLDQRIIAACRAAQNRRSMGFHRFERLSGPILRAAAAFAIVAAGIAVLVFSWRQQPAPADSGPGVGSVATMSQPASPGVRTGDVKLATAVDGSGRGALSAGTRSGPLPIGTRVEHVWVVKNLAQGHRFLLNELPESSQRQSDLLENDLLRLNVILSDRDLQKLVDTLAQSGMSLVSPDAPQPDDVREWNEGPRKVLYQVSLVPTAE